MVSLCLLSEIATGFAAVLQGFYGNVHVRDGLLVGLPAVAGVLFGTWLQQRVPVKWISILFALLLVAVAIDLVVS